MTFASPYWLYGGLLGAALFALALWAARAQASGQLKTYAEDRLLAPLLRRYSPGARLLKDWLVIISVVAICTALARPQMGYTWEESQSKGIDIAIAIDVSKSMLAQDIKPSRLERAKLAVLDFIAQSRGDRVGLIAFAGNAFLQCPLTLDYDALRLTLEDFEPGIIPVGGTNIAEAIEEAAASLDAENNFKIVILITDGEDLSAQGIVQAKKLAEEGVTIYTVGVGSEEGELIPIDNNGITDYIRDQEGNVVKSRLDTSTLEAIARATGGFYVPLGNTGEGLRYVYEQGLGSIPAQEREAKPVRKPIERYGWFLAAGVFLLILESCVSTRRKDSPDAPVDNNIHRAANALILTVIPLVITLSSSQSACANPRSAAEALAGGDYDTAITAYEAAIQNNPKDIRLHYNKGIAHYRKAEYNLALAEFEKALSTRNQKLQSDALYNLGNTLYRRGQSLIRGSAEQGHGNHLLDEYPPEENLSLGASVGESDEPQPGRDLLEQAQENASARLLAEETWQQYQPLVDSPPKERKPAWEACEPVAGRLKQARQDSEGLPGFWESPLADWASAVEYYSSSLILDEQRQDAQLNRSIVKARLDEYQQARQDTEEFLKNVPALIEQLDKLIAELKRPSPFILETEQAADRLVIQGNYLDALQEMQQAAEQDPTAIHYEGKMNRLEELLNKLSQGGQPQ